MNKTDTPVLKFTFGEFIKNARLAKGLSQQEVAQRANVNQTCVGKVERDERDPSLGIALRLCEALGLDINDYAHQKI